MENSKQIFYGRQTISNDDINAVVDSLKSDYLTTGPQVTRFESMLCKVTGAKYAIACSNGTTALHLACLSLGINKKDIGITSSNTFLASGNCIEFCGGQADFVDISMDTLCISVEQIEDYCKRNAPPKVVIPVDFAGVPAPLVEIRELSKKYGFFIIEDAAHSIGSTYSHLGIDYSCGCCQHSDIAIFSFHPVKTITTGEGGAVLTNNADLANKIRLFRSHGMTKDPSVLIKNDGPWYYEMVDLGNNYRITDLQCALGCSQIKSLGDFKKKRQSIVKQYSEAFSSNKDLIVPPWPSHTSPCFHLYPIQFKGGEKIRREMYDKLQKKNIFTQVHYIPVHTQPYYANKYGYKTGKCQNAELYYSRCLSLPLYPSLSQDDINYVIKSFLDILEAIS